MIDVPALPVKAIAGLKSNSIYNQYQGNFKIVERSFHFMLLSCALPCAQYRP